MIAEECLQYYMDYTTDFHQSVGQVTTTVIFFIHFKTSELDFFYRLIAFLQVLTDRCSAGSGGVDIIVDFKRTVAKKTSDNLIEMTFTMMISPNLPQPRVYDLCGQTHDLIFDLSITDTNEIIQDLISVPASDTCPAVSYIKSDVSRGFVCSDGEVLNTILASDVPRCLECPAGFFAAKGASKCTACPKGMYQDEVRRNVSSNSTSQVDKGRFLDSIMYICHLTNSRAGLPGLL